MFKQKQAIFLHFALLGCLELKTSELKCLVYNENTIYLYV